MKVSTNKIYLELHGKPVITYAIAAFEASEIDEIILMVSPGHEEYVREEIVKKYGYQKVVKIIPGGRERFESVFLGIEACEEAGEEHYIFIHDGARPFIQPEKINHCIEEVVACKACVVGMPVKDTIRMVDEDGYSLTTPDRRYVWQMQTPQCFLLSEARNAFRLMMASGDQDITDDVMVLERYGNRRSKMVEGSYDNMKLTTPEDMIIGETILRKYLGENE